MKKIMIGLVLTIAFLFVAVYLFIPGKIRIERSATIAAALPGVSRVLTAENNWIKWWPTKNVFTYNGEKFKLGGNAFNVIDVDIYSGTDTIKSRMELILINNDSMTLIWTGSKSSSLNPFERFARYRDSKRLEKNMGTILDHIQSFFEKPENVYGYTINKVKVVDSILISTRRSFDHKPGAMEIDAMIQDLKKYIADNGAKEMNYPMLNATKLGDTEYEVMTAIPVDRALPDTKDFATKYMLKGGNILESPVQGGPYTIERAIEQLEVYRADHQYTSPAIPYQLLVTDRTKETDTTKWITKLYYPVL